MGKRSVYQGLKNAIRLKGLPHFAFDDAATTILFESWEQFSPFDALLDSLPTPPDLKLCIYAERVNGNPDGVAVTVSDEVQRLGYWQMYLRMEERVAAFEELISQVLRLGAELLDFDYENFSLELDRPGCAAFLIAFGIEPRRFLPAYARHWVSNPSERTRALHLEFAFDDVGYGA